MKKKKKGKTPCTSLLGRENRGEKNSPLSFCAIVRPKIKTHQMGEKESYPRSRKGSFACGGPAPIGG